MSTAIITLEIFEQYLKTKGWTVDDGFWSGKNWRGDEGCGFPAAWIANDPLDIDALIRVAGDQRGARKLIAVLGVLASAELLFGDMAATKAEQGEDYEDLDGHDVAIDDVIRHRIDRLIRAADIDTKVWAAARNQ